MDDIQRRAVLLLVEKQDKEIAELKAQIRAMKQAGHYLSNDLNLAIEICEKHWNTSVQSWAADWKNSRKAWQEAVK